MFKKCPKIIFVIFSKCKIRTKTCVLVPKIIFAIFSKHEIRTQTFKKCPKILKFGQKRAFWYRKWGWTKKGRFIYI